MLFNERLLLFGLIGIVTDTFVELLRLFELLVLFVAVKLALVVADVGLAAAPLVSTFAMFELLELWLLLTGVLLGAEAFRGVGVLVLLGEEGEAAALRDGVGLGEANRAVVGE